MNRWVQKLSKLTVWRVSHGSRNKNYIRFVTFFETPSGCCVLPGLASKAFFSAPSLYASCASYLQKFPGIRCLLYRTFCLPVYCSLWAHLWRLWIKKWTSPSFFGLECDQKEMSQKWRVNIWFLLHDNASARRSVSAMDFLTKEQCDNTGASLTWFQLIFACYLDWNRRLSDSAFVVLLISLRMRRKNWKGFYKMTSRNVAITFKVAVRSL